MKIFAVTLKNAFVAVKIFVFCKDTLIDQAYMVEQSMSANVKFSSQLRNIYTKLTLNLLKSLININQCSSDVVYINTYFHFDIPV